MSGNLVAMPARAARRGRGARRDRTPATADQAVLEDGQDDWNPACGTCSMFDPFDIERVTVELATRGPCASRSSTGSRSRQTSLATPRSRSTTHHRRRSRLLHHARLTPHPQGALQSRAPANHGRCREPTGRHDARAPGAALVDRRPVLQVHRLLPGREQPSRPTTRWTSSTSSRTPASKSAPHHQLRNVPTASTTTPTARSTSPPTRAVRQARTTTRPMCSRRATTPPAQQPPEEVQEGPEAEEGEVREEKRKKQAKTLPF